eukprot:1158086-Pelagomonas_calceolata.AAC.6
MEGWARVPNAQAVARPWHWTGVQEHMPCEAALSQNSIFAFQSKQPYAKRVAKEQVENGTHKRGEGQMQPVQMTVQHM